MKETKRTALLLAALLTAAGLVGCGTGNTNQDQVPHDNGAGTGSQSDAASVKTGLSVLADISGSKDAANGENGTADANFMAVGVMVDDNGIIQKCVIDQVKAKMEFDDGGRLVTALDTVFPSKNDLGMDYGMKSASSIGKEWNEQARAFADYVEGKTLDQVMGIAIDNDGKAQQPELTASVTISVGDFMVGVQDAVRDAEYRGARLGDDLELKIRTTMAESEDAAGTDYGEAIAHAEVILETRSGTTVTSGDEEDISAGVEFDRTGVIVNRDID